MAHRGRMPAHKALSLSGSGFSVQTHSDLIESGRQRGVSAFGTLTPGDGDGNGSGASGPGDQYETDDEDAAAAIAAARHLVDESHDDDDQDGASHVSDAAAANRHARYPSSFDGNAEFRDNGSTHTSNECAESLREFKAGLGRIQHLASAVMPVLVGVLLDLGRSDVGAIVGVVTALCWAIYATALELVCYRVAFYSDRALQESKPLVDSSVNFVDPYGNRRYLSPHWRSGPPPAVL